MTGHTQMFRAMLFQVSCSSYCGDWTPIAACSRLQQRLLGNASEI